MKFCLYTGAPQGFSRTPDTIEKKPGPVVGLTATSMTTSLPSSDTKSLQAEGAYSHNHHSLAAGDNVRVELEVEIFKMMQDGHGEWDQQLLDVSVCIYIYVCKYSTARMQGITCTRLHVEAHAFVGVNECVHRPVKPRSRSLLTHNSITLSLYFIHWASLSTLA